MGGNNILGDQLIVSPKQECIECELSLPVLGGHATSSLSEPSEMYQVFLLHYAFEFFNLPCYE